MNDFLRLIRLPNLIIIILTMCGIRYGLLEALWIHAAEILKAEGTSDPLIGHLHMPLIHFVILLISVISIAAGGYIINDYFDIKADRINKPDRVFITSSTERRTAILGHLVFSFIGLTCGIYLAWKVGNWKLASIHLFSIISLWFYSAFLKRQLLIGNILIAFMALLVPVTAGLFEMISGAVPSLERLDLYVFGEGTRLMIIGTILIAGYGIFAFLSNLLREIIKDAEDMQGDSNIGRKTMPLVLGEITTRYIILFFLFFTIFLLGMTQRYIYEEGMDLYFWYITIAIQIPLLALGVFIWRSKEKTDYTQCSLITKFIIVSGVISMFIFRYSF